MPDSDRTVTASTKLDEQMVSFLDGQAESMGLTRAELLRRLAEHYRSATEDGLSCPHCKNEILIDL